MVFTDGDATDKAQIPAAVAKWRSRGVKIYAVGIGWMVSQRGINKINNGKTILDFPNIVYFILYCLLMW